MFCVTRYIIGWLTLNSITHYPDQFVQLLEGTHLDYIKYRAALILQNIFLPIEFMIYGMNCLTLLSTLSLSLYLKSDCVVLIFLLVCAIHALFLCDFSWFVLLFICAVYILLIILQYILIRSYGNVSNLFGSFALNKQQQQQQRNAKPLFSHYRSCI